MSPPRLRTLALALAGASLLAALAATPAALAGRAADVRTRAFEELNQGVAAYRRGDYAVAAEFLASSASAALNSFRAHFYLGLALIGDRRYEEAVEALTVALDLDPSHLQAHVAMGDARLKQGDLNEARASYVRALQLRPEYAPALDGIARIEEAGDDRLEAERTFRRAIASDAGFAPAYTHLGDLYLRDGRFEEAVDLLEEAVSVRPDFAPGLNRLALAYGQLGLFDEAYSTIRRALELEPAEASHPATLGHLQLEQGFLSAADEWFVRALERDPTHPEARRGLAEVARRRGYYDTALEHLARALDDPRIDPLKADELREFAAAIEAERDRLAVLEATVGSGEATSEQFGQLAVLMARRERWDDAVALQQRTALGYDDRRRLAYMLFRADRYREALDLYRELSSEGPTAELAVNTGVAAARLGQDADAAAAFRRALELDPNLDVAHLYLANALLRMGDEAAAVESYLRFLGRTERGEAAERVRRILERIAPDRVPGLPQAPPPGAEPAAEEDRS